MSEQVDWQSIGFRSNPFEDLTPQTDPKELVWAGMPKIKARFETILRDSLAGSKKRVVLIYGPHGGGKTHAAMFFKYEPRLQHLILPNGVRRIHLAYIRTPKEGGIAERDFYLNLGDELGFTRMVAQVRQEIASVGPDNGLATLKRITGSEEFAKAVVLLGTESEDEKLGTLKRYLYLDSTKTDRRRLGINRDIATTGDRFKVLSAILSCFIGLREGRKLQEHNRFILWIDEMEDLLFFTAKQHRPFTQGLRDLIDSLDYFITIFMNITLTAPEVEENVKVLFGNALWERISDQIYFGELTVVEGLEYVKDLLRQYRRKGNKVVDTYPFENGALKRILESMTKRTPREINRWCNTAIEFAFTGGLFEKSRANQPFISEASITQISKELERKESE